MSDENGGTAKTQVSSNGIASDKSGREDLFAKRSQLIALSKGAQKVGGD